MNVFILCTGRCGSTTIARACEHITNFSVGHESRDGLLGNTRFAYPAFHIEVDNRLSWMLGRLDRIYGERAFYVHLTREAAADSFARKSAGTASVHLGARMLDHYQVGIVRAECSYRECAEDYVDTVTANIRLFLKDKPNTIGIQLERWHEQFPIFWERIGAEGDLDEALLTLEERHNAA